MPSVGTVIVLLIVFLACAMALKSVLKKKGGCDCGCSGCSSSCCPNASNQVDYSQGWSSEKED